MHVTSRTEKIYVAGHRGLVGSAVVRALQRRGYQNLLLRTRTELDLRDQRDVEDLFLLERPDFVILSAAKVGGILANNSFPADFISDNLAIQTNVIRACHETGVKRLVFLGSSCIYPRLAPQPMKEEHLLTGALEQTNEWYAIAKIAGIKMCQAYHRQFGDDFLCLMPTNLYGPGDNFDLETSHVLPALIRKFHEAKREGGTHAPVTLWGTGRPRREFLYSDDLADACLFILGLPEDTIRQHAPDGILNVGVGKDTEIRELAQIIRGVAQNRSEVLWDTEKPDGTPRKLLDVSRMESLN
jgi:GDP-L-fucose synthase